MDPAARAVEREMEAAVLQRLGPTALEASALPAAPRPAGPGRGPGAARGAGAGMGSVPEGQELTEERLRGEDKRLGRVRAAFQGGASRLSREKGLQQVDATGTLEDGVVLWGSRHPGPATVFEAAPPDAYLCLYCRDLLHQPVLFPCGHSFCRACVNTPGERLSCPECKTEHLREHVQADDTAQQMIQDLRILCQWSCMFKRDGESLQLMPDGCRRVLKLGEREKHEMVCEKALVRCQFVDDSDPDAPVRCPAPVRRCHAREHEAACPFRPVRCAKCRKKVAFRALARHLERECTVHACPNGCGATFRMEDADEHMRTACPFLIVQCTFVDDATPELAQCNNFCRRKDLRRHQAACEFRRFQCEHCRELVPVRRAQWHAARCTERPVPCPRNCGELVPRHYLEQHLETECPDKTVECEYRRYGCGHRALRSQMPSHMRECMAKHMSLVTRHVNTFEDRFAAIDKRVEGVARQLDGELKQRDTEFTILKGKLGVVEKEHRESLGNVCAEVDALGRALHDPLNDFIDKVNFQEAQNSEARTRLYREFKAVEATFTEEIQYRFAEVQRLQNDFNAFRLASADAMDDMRADHARQWEERGARGAADKAELGAAIAQVRKEVEEDSVLHITKLTCLTEEIGALEGKVAGILRETSLQRDWPDRRAALIQTSAAARLGGADPFLLAASGGKGQRMRSAASDLAFESLDLSGAPDPAVSSLRRAQALGGPASPARADSGLKRSPFPDLATPVSDAVQGASPSTVKVAPASPSRDRREQAREERQIAEQYRQRVVEKQKQQAPPPKRAADRGGAASPKPGIAPVIVSPTDWDRRHQEKVHRSMKRMRDKLGKPLAHESLTALRRTYGEELPKR